MVPETSFHGQPLSEKGFHEASGKALKDQKLRKNFNRAMNGLMQKRRVMFPDSGELETLRNLAGGCLLYTSPSPRDPTKSRMPSSA